MNDEPNAARPPEIRIRQEDIGGVWANFAVVSHSPFEFTIDFTRLDFSQDPVSGVVVARVNLSPLFVAQLLDALQENWTKYAQRAMPKEVHDGASDQGPSAEDED